MVIRIKVKFYGYLSYRSKKELILEYKNKVKVIKVIEDALSVLDNRSRTLIKKDILEESPPRAIIMLNRRNIIYTGGLSTEIVKDSVLEILPPLVGGMSTYY